MRSVDSWDLTNNKLHQLFKEIKNLFQLKSVVILVSQLQDG